MLTIPGQVNGPKLAFNAICTDTAVSQDLGVIGRDNQNRIRWGNLLTLPVGQGGLLYVAPVYASPGSSDAASQLPTPDPGGDDVQRQGRLRARRSARPWTASSAPAREPRPPVPSPLRAASRAPTAAAADVPAQVAEVPTPPVAAMPPGGMTLSPAKAAALQEMQSALGGGARGPAQSGNFAQYGAALQRLDEAMGKFDGANRVSGPPRR